MTINVTFGAFVDLEFLKDFTRESYPFIIDNDDSTDYDFSNSGGAFFNLYAKKNGKLLLELEFAFSSPVSNSVYLSAAQIAQIAAFRAKQYYHVAYDLVDGEKITLFQGITSVI